MHGPGPKKFWKPMLAWLIILIAALTLYGWWHSTKPLPSGLNFSGMEHPVAADRVTFLADLTTATTGGERISDQHIFPALFTLIDQAERYILLDFFLLNDHRGREAGLNAKPLAGLLMKHLLARKQQVPDLVVDILTDPINSAYNGAEAKVLNRLRAAGINIIETDLDPLRDSNPLYSLWWRLLLRWIPDWGHYLPHPFDADGAKVSLASWLRLVNFKANHRKVAVIDQDDTWVSLVTSANPHGASRYHSNVGLLVVDDRLATDLYLSEQAVARMSGSQLQPFPELSKADKIQENSPEMTVRLMTEARIRTAICTAIDASTQGDRIRMAMFYLADRHVIEALLNASHRGTTIELILDPNRDAFGYEKNGVPNRPVASELVQKSGGQVAVRWYQTHGEQFHSKLVLVEQADGDSSVFLGSANLTRRNIGNYNLETDLLLKGPATSAPIAAINDYFSALWDNREETYTRPYPAFADPSSLKYFQYRVQEAIGLGTF